MGMIDDNLRSDHRHGEAWDLEPMTCRGKWELGAIALLVIALWVLVVWGLAQ